MGEGYYQKVLRRMKVRKGIIGKFGTIIKRIKAHNQPICILTLIVFIITSCFANYGEKAMVGGVHHSKDALSSTDPKWTIEDLSAYIFSKKFLDIKTDSVLNKEYTINKSSQEDEGVEWNAYNFIKNGKPEVLVENNWEDSTLVYRITFLSGLIKTADGIGVNSSFKEIKPMIDIKRLNSGPDGTLLFYSKQLPKLAYEFEADSTSDLYYGVKGLNSIPDTLKINAIVIFR